VREALDGVRIAITTPGLGPALLLVAGSAGFILSVSSLLVLLLARTHGWEAGAAGLIVGSQGVGAIVVNLVVARKERAPGRASPRSAGSWLPHWAKPPLDSRR
jgi:hypothetical protein